jgi:hypothetical protein
MGVVSSPVGQRDQTRTFHWALNPDITSSTSGAPPLGFSDERHRPHRARRVAEIRRAAGARCCYLSSACYDNRHTRDRERAPRPGPRGGSPPPRVTLRRPAEAGRRYARGAPSRRRMSSAARYRHRQTTERLQKTSGKLLPTNFPLFPLSPPTIHGWTHAARREIFSSFPPNLPSTVIPSRARREISYTNLPLFPLSLPHPRLAALRSAAEASDPPATSPADDATHGALGTRLRGSAYISRAIASDRHSLIILERVNIPPPPPPPKAFLNTSTSRPLSYLSSSRRVRAGRTSPLPSSHPSLRLRPAPTTTTTSSRGGAPKHPTRRRRRRRLPPDDCPLR